MTNKQTTQQKTEGGGHSIANEELNENLILHSWRGVQLQVQKVREFNRQQGVNPDAYIGYNYDDSSPPPMSVKQKIRWLGITKHKRSGEWITIDKLLASGTISEMEKEAFGQGKYPRIELVDMTRVKTNDGSEYLVRNMRAFGLSEIGAVLTLPLPDCDFTRKVPIIPTTAKSKDGNDVRILQVGTGEFTYESSPKIYTTKFSRDRVLAALEKYPPSEDNDTQGRITYAFKKDGVTNEVGISSLEEFLGDFDSIWETKRAPAPTIHLDSKDILNYVKHDRDSIKEHKQYS